MTDPTGAVLANAVVTLSDPSHGYKNQQKANNLGKFEFPDVAPGTYKVAVEAPGFVTYAENVTVRVGLSTPVEARMKVGAAATELTVEGAAENIDPIRSTVQGIVSGNQIDSLPLNGRNFLDLAQQQPGVVVVDGGDFDPTKNGMTGVSVGGRTGRVTRIQVDGVDITDETVGTTVANISNEAIQEFNIAQSNLDPSTDMTSSGAVNIITRSGSNAIHGSGFFLFRDSAIAADQRVDKTDPLNPTQLSPKPPFRRKLMGGRVGGPFIKDKWFWHVEYERNQQARSTITTTPLFPQFNGAHPVPFNERMAGARTDFNLSNNIKLFYRFSHNWNNGVTGFGGTDLQAYANLNNTNIHVVGMDYASGHFTHQARFSYVNFNNFIIAANDQAQTPLSVGPGAEPVQFYESENLDLVLGPDYLAPQKTFQDNKQIKYDGSFLHGRHTIRFGAEVNHIVDGLYAAFFANGPRAWTTTSGMEEAAANPSYVPFNSNGFTDPLNWPLLRARVSNGLGYFSEIPTHNQPFGGLINTRVGFYGQDTIQVTRNLNVNIGLRWTLNTNLDNNDLARAHTVALFDQRLASNPVRPTNNFGPSFGFAWNVRGDGRTVLRGGAGLYYETNIINSFMFDRKTNVPPGFGASYPYVGGPYSPVLKDPITGSPVFDFTTQCTGVNATNNCFAGTPISIGAALPFIIQGDLAYKTAYAAAAAAYPTPGAKDSFDLNHGTIGGDQLVFPQYKTPYGIQANIGFQRELKKGLVLTADYVRNHGVHFNSQVDWNRIGAADTLNVPAAITAINNTFNAAGCGTGLAPGTPAWTTAVNCTIAAGYKISKFASKGLGSGVGYQGMAFGGMNRNFQNVYVIMPVGLSTFQALQVALRGDVGSWGFLKKVSTNVTYQLGRFETTNADQDFNSVAAYNDRPTKFYGPYNQDRTHQFGFTFSFELPGRVEFTTTNALRSRRASSLFLSSGGSSADIFYDDLDGDGITADPVPGTNRGAFGRTVMAGTINNLIDKYNSTYAGQLTPAGVALVNAGLFSEAQLKSLGAVAKTLAPADAGQVDNPWFFNSDLRLSKTVKITEHLNVVPMMEIFNVFNHANYNALSETLNGGLGSPNGTTSLLENADRVGFGSGSFSPGTQRAFQFGVRVNW